MPDNSLGSEQLPARAEPLKATFFPFCAIEVCTQFIISFLRCGIALFGSSRGSETNGIEKDIRDLDRAGSTHEGREIVG